MSEQAGNPYSPTRETLLRELQEVRALLNAYGAHVDEIQEKLGELRCAVWRLSAAKGMVQ
jgi:hypothetical protein